MTRQTTIQAKPRNWAAGLTVKEEKLLNSVVSYYQHTLGVDSRAIHYLKQQLGVRDIQSVKDFRVGYANGTLLEILPEEESVLASLKKIGILTGTGHECLRDSVVFPLYSPTGTVINLYGRSISDQSSRPELFLLDARSGLINPAYSAVKRSHSMILTDSIIGSLILYDQGFKNVIPLSGGNELTKEHLSLFNRRISNIYLVFSANGLASTDAEAVAEQLREQGIKPYTVALPTKDLAVYFRRHTPEEFEKLLKEVNPESFEQSDKVSKRSQTLYKETEHGFVVGYGERQYEIKGIQRGETRLMVTIKASKVVDRQRRAEDPRNVQASSPPASPERGRAGPFELTTIDLYSSRSRLWFAKACADLFGASEELIKEDLNQVLTLVETYRPKKISGFTKEPTLQERKEALRFLKSPEMFAEILSDFETLGISGEETNKLVGYISAVSRKLEEPLSVLIQSRSAAGKTTLQDAVLCLVPEEDYVKYTRITDQALFYKGKESLAHKILAIEEQEGVGGAGYSVRNIQSARQITVAATGKDPATGKMRAEEYTVRGPVAVMITTTAVSLDGETASRFLLLTIDESIRMTEAIHRLQRQKETLEGLIIKRKKERIIRKHHTAQRLLKTLEVVNPYAEYLSYPVQTLCTRRDHKKYLGLIRAVAFLFQYQKESKTVAVEGQSLEYVEVSLDDIERANQLANEVLGQSLDELTRPSRTLLSLICDMVKEWAEKEDTPFEEIVFTRRQVREYTGWSDWQVKTHIKLLEELEYLHVRSGSRGKGYSYALLYCNREIENRKHYLHLTSVQEIKQEMAQEQAGQFLRLGGQA